MHGNRYAHKVWSEILKEQDPLEDMGINERVRIKLI